MNKYNYLLFLILILIINIKSQSIDNYNCLTLFVEKFGLKSKYLVNENPITYNFCQYGTNCYVPAGGLLNLENTVSSNLKVELNDLSCLSFYSITLKGYSLSSNILYTKLNCTNLALLESIFDSVSISQAFPIYPLLSISTNSFNNSLLKLSYINNIGTFSLSKSQVYIENDIVQPRTNPLTLTIEVNNIVDFTGINLNNLYLTLGKSFDTTSFSNFSKIKAADTIALNSLSTQSLKLPTSIINTNSQNSQILYINGYFDSTTVAPIDISKITTPYIFSLTTYFSLNTGSLFPIIANKNTLVILENVNVASVQPLTKYEDIQYLRIIFSNIQGDLGVYDSTDKKYMDFSNNKITGTIDPSWCNVELAVTNNLMNGEIPSCFSCYFNAPRPTHYSTGYPDAMYERFTGNSFSNLNKSIECVTFAPKMDIDKNSSGLVVSGTDIGFDPDLWYVDDVKCSDFVIYSVGKEYLCITKTPNYFNNRLFYSVRFLEPGNRTYTFPTRDRFQIVDKVVINKNGLGATIIGSYFSSYLGYVNQIIKIGDINCAVTSTSFYSIECSLSTKLPLQPLVSLLNISSPTHSKSVYINTISEFVNDKQCPNDCMGGSTGICDKSNGVCVCQTGVTKADCTLSTCPSSNLIECSGNGVCNENTGVCQCTANKWSGLDCMVPYHYISAVQPSTESGGEAIFYGEFGNVHDGISLSIDGINCPITLNTSTIIKCIAPPGTGNKPIILIQNNLSASYIYNYIPLLYTCPNDCTSSSNGICNTTTGICKCIGNHYSFDCSQINTGVGNGNGNTGGGSNTTIDSGTGSTIISDQIINFEIYFKSLKEVDINNNIINEYPLLNNNLSFNKSENNIYNFKQTIGDDASNQGCIISTTIEEIVDQNGKDFTFAGSTFNIQSGSIKFTISISNYSYSSNLNTLQLDLISSVDEIKKDKCNNKQTEIDTSNVNDKSSSFNYIKISKNNKLLQGRFINKLVSDGKPTFLTTSVRNDSNSIIVSLNLPYCSECIIDPDFSVLVSSDYVSSCSNESNRKWVIPVAVVVSVVGACIIIVSIWLFYKRNSVKMRVIKLKFLNKN